MASAEENEVYKQFGFDQLSPLINWPMADAPILTSPKSHISFSDRLKPIMLEAFARPDVETRRHAIATFADAYARGMKEMKTVAPQLHAKLNEKNLHALERIALIDALAKLEFEEAGPDFVKLNSATDADPEVIQATDKPLSVWKTAGIEAVWKERITNDRTPRAIRTSAIERAGIAQFASIAGDLLKIALDRTGDPAYRLAAARSVSNIRREGLEQSALLLLDASSPAPSVLDRLIGVTLIRMHKGSEAQGIMLRMASDLEPAVVTIAAGRLVEIDPLLLTPVAAKLSTSSDVGVRALAVRSLAAQKTPIATSTLCPMMNDAAPEVRYYVRDQLILLDAVPTLRDRVRDGGMAVLGGSDWRGLENAALLLGKLDHKAAIDRLMEIKSNPRFEVRLAAVTAIRWLGVPATLPKLLAYVKELSDDAPDLGVKAAAGGKEGAAAVAKLIEVTKHDQEIAQIMQFFAVAQYKEAEPTLRKFIPKKSMPFNASRAAAIWTLGQFHIDDPDETLGSQFLARYDDTRDIMNPESGDVRHMALIAMGYMRYRKFVNTVTTYMKDDNSSLIADAGRWALKRVIDKDIPRPPDTSELQTGWFIDPHVPPAPQPDPAKK